MTKQRLDERLTGSAGVYFDAASLVASHRSEYQLIEIFECPDLGGLMRIDGVNMTSERDEFFYHESLIHPAATAHPNPQRALIIGGGDGGAAEELLKHPITDCVLCELDAEVVRLSREYLQSIHGDTFNDSRLQLHIGDGAAYVRTSSTSTPPAAFDLIYLDLTDPAGEAAELYSPAFFADCKTVLSLGGAMVLHIGSPFFHPNRVKETTANLRAQFRFVTPYFVHIPTYGATWGFAVASDTLDVGAVGAPTLHSRLAERRVESRRYYEADMHHAMLVLPPYIKSIGI
jgi:spermidine synthase